MRKKNTGPARPLSVLQINVGKGAISHEIALSLAATSFVDVILIQEPYIFTNRTRRISKAHPLYESFSPLDDWTTRPRVLTYVRKGSGLSATQLRPLHSRDLIFLQLQIYRSPPLILINAYNAPPGSTDAGAAVNAITSLPRALLRNTVLAGDFNIHHPRWNPLATLRSPLADSFTNWLDANLLCLTSEAGVSTHNKGNVLDLAFYAGPYLAATALAQTTTLYLQQFTGESTAHRP